MTELLEQDIKFLSGVGPKRAELLAKELGIYTYRDLLYFFPYKYIDRTKFYSIKEIHPELPYIQVKGKITSFALAGNRGKQRLTATFTDGTGIIELIWFKGLKWIRQTYKTGIEYTIFGKPSLFNRTINIIHPEIEESASENSRINASLQAVYSSTEKLKNNFLTSKVIQKFQMTLVRQVVPKISETIPAEMAKHYKLMPLQEALLNIHFPENPDKLRKASYRLKFEELFFIQLNIVRQKVIRNVRSKGYVFPEVGELFNRFYHEKLTFELTNAQKRVIREIRKDLLSGKQMNRLLQGDVGSGKTMVALMTALLAIDNGFQACLMAPTEILAIQHYKTISNMLDGLPVQVELLTGSTRKPKRNEISAGLLGGSLHLIVGTHALIEDTVQFKNLGLTIIDEQHRFGVAQRARLWAKSEQPPHVMVMTATPIPRTLAMTLYGDLEVSVIDELPPGRKPVQTIHYYDSKRLMMFGFLKKQIALGRQVYIVYPLIKESEKMDYKDLEDGYESIVREFPPPQYAVSIVHGKMKPEEKDISMRYFSEGQTNIMVATTVIEVGVDVPNASVMVIESAERFGLSQLHQLRGRVGRGADQSYCILMSSYKLSNEARKRIETMVSTNDGFEIAETDLKLRGPGNLEGTQQSGIPFDLKIANLGKDGQLLQYVRNIAIDLLDDDPHLEKPPNQLLKKQLSMLAKDNFNWSVIS
ncbi:MAG TPA: ATP-dependent DNA helicase RecG [Bacteroidales bacterium]|nr:ATP-dependent DNA helicase RecG [Bacteroidales bacterium]